MTVSRIFGPPERMALDGVAVDMDWHVPDNSDMILRAVGILDAGGVIAISGETDCIVLSAIDQLLPLLGGGHV